MNANELYEEFLKCCNEYEDDIFGITIKRGDVCLRISKPHDPEKNNYLIYELIEKSRMSGTVSDIDWLLELCVEVFGEDSVVKNSGYGYSR